MSGLERREPEVDLDHSGLSVPQHAAVHHLAHGAELDLPNGHARIIQFDPLHDHAVVHFTDTTDPHRIQHPDMPISVHAIADEIDRGKIRVCSTEPHQERPAPIATQEVISSPNNDDWLLEIKARFNKF